VGPVSFVEMLLGDNKGNQIILPHATWNTFITKRADIEKLLQSPAPSSLTIQDLIIEVIKMRDTHIVKKYCKIEITRCLLVCEAVDYIIFIHTQKLY